MSEISPPPQPDRGVAGGPLWRSKRVLRDTILPGHGQALAVHRLIIMQDMVGIGGFASVPHGHGDQPRPRAATYREVADFAPSWERRAQGMPGAPPHPQPRVQSKKAHELVTTGSPKHPAFPARMVLTGSFVLLCLQNLSECANGRFSQNRPSLDLSPFVLEGHMSLTGSVGQIWCLPQPEQLHGLRARTEQGRELDDGTKFS